jgi:hypothetical protein
MRDIQTSFLCLLLVEKAIDIDNISIIQDNARPKKVLEPSSPIITGRCPSFQQSRWRSDVLQIRLEREEELESKKLSRWTRRDSDSTLIKPSRREFLSQQQPTPAKHKSSSALAGTAAQIMQSDNCWFTIPTTVVDGC